MVAAATIASERRLRRAVMGVPATFHLIESVWLSSAVSSEPATADGSTMDRRILFIFTESIWPSSVITSQRRRRG